MIDDDIAEALLEAERLRQSTNVLHFVERTTVTLSVPRDSGNG